MTKYDAIDKITKRIFWFLAFVIYIFKDQIVGLFKKEELATIDKEDDLK